VLQIPVVGRAACPSLAEPGGGEEHTAVYLTRPFTGRGQEEGEERVIFQDRYYREEPKMLNVSPAVPDTNNWLAFVRKIETSP
jgi:hypothetical protein